MDPKPYLFAIGNGNSPEPLLGLLIDGDTLRVTGNLDAGAQAFFDEIVAKLHPALQELREDLLDAEREVEKWKNHHKTEVERARAIKCRPDIPVERKLLYEALTSAGVDGDLARPHPEYDVTKLETLEHVLDVYHAARKLVHCKGRYHSELNYKALAAQFGVKTPDFE